MIELAKPIKWDDVGTREERGRDKADFEVESKECYPLDSGSLDVFVAVTRERCVWPRPAAEFGPWSMEIVGQGRVPEFTLEMPVESPEAAKQLLLRILPRLLAMLGVS